MNRTMKKVAVKMTSPASASVSPGISLLRFVISSCAWFASAKAMAPRSPENHSMCLCVWGIRRPSAGVRTLQRAVMGYTLAAREIARAARLNTMNGHVRPILRACRSGFLLAHGQP